jgi:hypothetical protein
MLDQAAAAQLESLVANDANALREVASFADAAAAFAVASSLRVEPSVEQRTRILADIATLPQLPDKPAKTSAPEGYRYELSGSEGMGGYGYSRFSHQAPVAWSASRL